MQTRAAIVLKSIHKQAKIHQNLIMTTPFSRPFYGHHSPPLWVVRRNLGCQLRVNSPAAPIVSDYEALAAIA